MPWWSWVVLGGAFLIVELFVSTDFYLVFFGLGALMLALMGALDISMSIAMQWAVFAVLSIVTMVFFRNRLRRMIHTREAEVDPLEGQTVIALELIAAGGTGQAKFRGTVWSVRNTDTVGIDAGDPCTVESVEGLVLSILKAS